MKQNQFKFKPFDKVLVRDEERAPWAPSLYGFESEYEEGNIIYHCIDNIIYKECIPYNKNTAHLIGTREPYQPKEKEIKYEVTYGFGDDLTVDSYTEEEFKHFINIAVCNNKDVKDFSVNIIIPD